MVRFLNGCCVAAVAVVLAAGPLRAQVTNTAPPGAVPTGPTSGTERNLAPRSDNRGVEEIIVTAQRRAESLQKTALSVVVVQPSALAAAGVTNSQQLTSIVPSLQIGNGGPAPSVYLRGVGSYASNAVASPAIPFYTDGVYDARTQSIASEFYDVERIEVLKGPQGTLYGRNASGGAINLLTVNPVLRRVTGHADVEVGNYGNQNGEAAINLPVGDTVAVRLSGQIVDKGGYSSVGLGGDIHQSVRTKILWQPSADVSLLLNGSYGHLGNSVQTFAALNRDIPGWYPWLDSADPRAIQYALDHSPAAFLPPGAIVLPTKADARQKLNFYNVSATLNWKIGDITATLIPAYRYSSMQHAALVNTLFTNGYGFGDFPARPETSKATSVEMRLSGNSDRLKWVAGLYYFNEDQYQQSRINYGTLIDIGTTGDYGTRSYAAFGQTTLSLTDHLRLIAGLRYTIDKRSISNGADYFVAPTLFFPVLIPAGAACAFPFPTKAECIADQFAGKHTFKNFSWKGGFEADVLENGLAYATVSRGFKAGGYNTQSAFGRPGEALLFAPEILTSYEAGLKNRFFNNRLQLNLSAFYWNYKGHQEPKVGFTNAGTLNLIYFNAGVTNIYGGTAEIIARPWPHGTFNTSVEYAHSRYKDFVFQSTAISAGSACKGSPSVVQPGFVDIDCSGLESAKTPKWAGNFGYTHDVPIGDGRIVASGNVTFASSRWLAIDFTPIERAKGYATIDASLAYHSPADRWSIALIGRNLNNSRVYTQSTDSPLSTIVSAHINPPRSYAARLSVKF